MKKLLPPLAVILLIAIGYWGYQYYQSQQILKSVNSFADCAKHYPVMTSYPEQCRTPDGRLFTQDIGNELEYIDEIQVANPRPNQKITSPITIHGKVSGRWLFEATFSAELFDANNKSLGTAILTAEGEWMSIDFVPFRGEMTFANPSTATGTLKIINANPSGLPENEYILNIPVSFE